MKNIKFQNYNDGLFFYGDYVETYDSAGNAMKEKEFISNGKFFFSLTSIREQDRIAYDTEESKITMKLKIRYNTILKKKHIIKLTDNLYEIKHIDVDSKRENLYVYLINYRNQLDKHISIFKKQKTYVMEDDKFNHYRTVWGNIEGVNSVTNKEKTENNNLKSKFQKKFIIRYLDELDPIVNKKSTTEFKIKYKNNFYNITLVNNIEEENKILELIGEVE